MPLRPLLLLAGLAASLPAQGPVNAGLLAFPARDSTTACMLKRTDELPPGAAEAHLFWVGSAFPMARRGGPDGQVIATSPPPRQVWVSYDRTGLPLVLADTVYDPMGHSIAEVRFGPGRELSGFTQRADIDTALARRLMNDTAKRTLMEAVDSVGRALLRGPRTMLDSASSHRAREIAEFLGTRRCGFRS